MNRKKAKDPLRAFIRELLKIPGVKELFYKHFKLPLRLKRSFDRWCDKSLKGLDDESTGKK